MVVAIQRPIVRLRVRLFPPQPCQHLVLSDCFIFLNRISLIANLGIFLQDFWPFWVPLLQICFSFLSIGFFIIFGLPCSSVLSLSSISGRPYFQAPSYQSSLLLLYRLPAKAFLDSSTRSPITLHTIIQYFHIFPHTPFPQMPLS